MTAIGAPQLAMSAQDQAESLARHAESSMEDLNRHVRATQHGAILFTIIAHLVALVTAVLVGVYLYRAIARPIARLSSAASRVSSGDLDTQITVEREDELGLLSRRFNEMTGAVKEHQQKLLQTDYAKVDRDGFLMLLHKDDQAVLESYLMPAHVEAMRLLGSKYRYTPKEKVRVEVLHDWDDFSVRTIGFRGFTALGACFGPFITLVNPGDSDLRRQDFMWSATVWHEYTHVLTLALSRLDQSVTPYSRVEAQLALARLAARAGDEAEAAKWRAQAETGLVQLGALGDRLRQSAVK